MMLLPMHFSWEENYYITQFISLSIKLPRKVSDQQDACIIKIILPFLEDLAPHLPFVVLDELATLLTATNRSLILGFTTEYLNALQAIRKLYKA